MDEYVIHVTKIPEPHDYLNGSWAVGFSHAKTYPATKNVTFCCIRRGIDAPIFAGCTFQNPHDHYDADRGEKEAFKRAVENFAGCTEHYEIIMSRFRGALWCAKGRPGYAKSKILSDLHKGLNNILEG